MKALLLTAASTLEVADVPKPSPKADELLVRVAACGICGSDVHGYDGSSGRRIPPLVMGHEAAGTVEAVGEGVRQFKAGDRVTFDSTVWCGVCFFCRRGEVNLCDARQVLGVSCPEFKRDGCFAEYVTVPERIAYRLPEALSFEQAAMVEAVSIAFHAVRRAAIVLGESVVVVGAGMIGQLIIQSLRASGAGKIVAVDIDDSRLALAKKYGADATVRGDAKDVVPQLVAHHAGRGADQVFEAVGNTAAVGTAIGAVRKGGKVTLVGNISKAIELPLQAVVTREISLLGSCASAGEYPACLEAMARGTIDVRPFVSATAGLEEGAAYFKRLHDREPGLLKVILKP